MSADAQGTAPAVPATIAEALAALQGRMPRVAKEASGQAGSHKYLYARLEDITPALYPVMASLGLSFNARPTLCPALEERFVLAYELRHVNGERIEGCYPLPDPARYGPQDLGKAITYARRYALCAITGLAPGGDDDDAQGIQAAGAQASRLPRTGTNAELRAAGRMDRRQAAGHDKLKTEVLRDRSRAERSRPNAPSPDSDPWAADEPMTPQRAAQLRQHLDAERAGIPEDQPGSILPGQKRAIEMLLTKLGVTRDNRDERHAVLASLIMGDGQELPADPAGEADRPSVNGMSYIHATNAIRALQDELTAEREGGR